MAYEILSDKSYSFALKIVELYRYLRESHQNYGLGDQVLRSGTSIGANISEAVYSQSTSDNISKLSIALKEANETKYWLRFLTDASYILEETGCKMLEDCEELIKMLVAVIKTLKSKV